MSEQMRILNLGAGVQSTTIFLMAHEGVIPMIDHAIFADTQEEPEAVYQHLAWLRTVPEPVPLIHVGPAGRIGDDLMRGERSAYVRSRNPGHKYAKANSVIPAFTAPDHARFAQIPAFTAPGEPIQEVKDSLIECPSVHKSKQRHKRKIGKLRRQCTKEYKLEVVERIIRREIMGLQSRQRMPKGTLITQLFGISLDERRRADRIRKRFEVIKWAQPAFPLIEMKMTRDDCKDWLKPRVPHETPRSACVFCPFKSAEEWLRTKQSPEEWARAVEVDAGLRVPGVIAQRGMNQPIYVHRSAIPLPMVDLEDELAKEKARKRRPLFEMLECGEGMCGV